ncbi:hypothetical protein GCM10010348_62300 [Streptomyces anthocyanicus]|nr:hypothetical protein GCM10010348_62300 [Streptomyces anthocyanicus]
MRLTLLAALCHVRQTEITDSLVELFIQLVLKINTRAERKVERELGAELKKVRGKEAMLLRVAEAALAEPAGVVRRVIYPVVGGEKTLKALAAEAAANEARYKVRVRTVLRSAYSAHWRRMLKPLLKALELKCNNTAYRPVMDAIGLLTRYMDQLLEEGAFFDEAERIPLKEVVPEQWRAAVVDERGRVERVPYELCVLVFPRDVLRQRSSWVAGANRWRNPEDDLPPDFEDNRDVHYAAIRQPQGPEEFIAALQNRLRASSGSVSLTRQLSASLVAQAYDVGHGDRGQGAGAGGSDDPVLLGIGVQLGLAPPEGQDSLNPVDRILAEIAVEGHAAGAAERLGDAGLLVGVAFGAFQGYSSRGAVRDTASASRACSARQVPRTPRSIRPCPRRSHRHRRTSAGGTCT